MQATEERLDDLESSFEESVRCQVRTCPYGVLVFCGAEADWQTRAICSCKDAPAFLCDGHREMAAVMTCHLCHSSYRFVWWRALR